MIRHRPRVVTASAAAEDETLLVGVIDLPHHCIPIYEALGFAKVAEDDVHEKQIGRREFGEEEGSSCRKIRIPVAKRVAPMDQIGEHVNAGRFPQDAGASPTCIDGLRPVTFRIERLEEPPSRAS
jgi:hypothetical protein